MSKLNILYSFRARLLLVLAGLLVATLGVQYYLNRRAERLTAHLIAEQEKALAESLALAMESITSARYMYELEEERGRSLLEEHAGHITNVLLVNEEGRVDDSLDRQYTPRALDDGSARYYHLSELPLPKFADVRVPDKIMRLAPAATAQEQPVAGEARALPIPVKTTTGENYVIVLVGEVEARREHSHWQDVEPLLPTLAVLLAATLVTALLVWRFTRPISDLSVAARRVASGDFGFLVPAAERRDEVGALASTFNEMIAGLARARQLGRQLHDAERSAMAGRFASAIAHEIKNPLNYINLTLDHLRTSLAPEDEKKRELFGRLTAQVKTEVARINTRIREFLNYARPAELEMRPLDLGAEVADALRMVEMQAAESGVETRVEAGETPTVNGDRESLRSVFTNLMINALQAMEGAGGGRLTVAVSSEDGRARVRISDTGAGIPPEYIEKVFEPYFSTKETGTGLGLAIVRKAVEDHGGRISVESRQGEGTTFTVILPTANNDA